MEPSLPFGRHSCWKDFAGEGEDEDRPERPYGRRRNLANCLRKEPRSGPALKESPLLMLGSSHTCSLVGTWTLAEGHGPQTTQSYNTRAPPQL